MNVHKLWRMLDAGAPIRMGMILQIRRLIGESLVVFFSQLKDLREGKLDNVEARERADAQEN